VTRERNWRGSATARGGRPILRGAGLGGGAVMVAGQAYRTRELSESTFSTYFQISKRLQKDIASLL
jgi:hypothetical protein